jgi:hypothetical protein
MNVAIFVVGVAGRDKEILLSQTFVKDFSQKRIKT